MFRKIFTDIRRGLHLLSSRYLRLTQKNCCVNIKHESWLIEKNLKSIDSLTILPLPNIKEKYVCALVIWYFTGYLKFISLLTKISICDYLFFQGISSHGVANMEFTMEVIQLNNGKCIVMENVLNCIRKETKHKEKCFRMHRCLKRLNFTLFCYFCSSFSVKEATDISGILP